MSKLEELIKEFCPNGVEYKTLNELGTFYGGLSGKSKEDFKDGNAKFITYLNVFTNLALNIETSDRVKIHEGEKQNTIQYGDVIFTGSSETPDECGISSVLTQHTDEKLYLNSFCFGFRLNNKNILLPDFCKYVFRSENIRKQINKTASGVTRYNVSKKKMGLVKIPVLPLPVQEEIVRILDNFTALTSEIKARLTSELMLRKKQYEYYRNKLLAFSFETTYSKIRDISIKISSGGTPKTNVREYYSGNIPWLRTQEVDFNDIFDTAIHITQCGLANSSAKWIPENCIIVAMYGATVGKVAINKIPLTTNQACCNIQIDPAKALYKYVFHYLAKQYKYIKSLGQGSQTNINAEIVKNLEIPLPPLDVQERLVNVLDNFEAICSDLNIGLPAEIEARRRQYEFYRDFLLNFNGNCGIIEQTDRQTDRQTEPD